MSTPPSTTPDAAMAPRPRRRRTALLAVAVLLLVVVAWAGYAAVAARADLLAVRADLTALRDAPPDDLAGLADALEGTAERSSRARSLMTAPGPALVASVPLLGRSLAAERDVAVAGDAVVQAVRRVLPRVAALEVDGGRVEPEALEELAQVVDDAAQQVRGPVDDLVAAPTGLTPAAVGDAVQQAREALRPVADAFDRAGAGVRAARGLLGGDRPRTLVVAVMNNAEARGAGGYAGSFAVVRAVDGAVDVEPFRDVNEVFDPPGQAVQVPTAPDFSRRWGPFLADTTLWKNAMMSPHVPDSLAALCAVAQRRPGIDCDGAMVLDVPAMAALMTLSGPVDLPGGAVEGDELVEALLVEAYADAEAESRSQAERRATLLAAADRALDGLLSGGLTAAPAVRVVADAAAGRHLAVWSADDDEQRALEAAGLSGSADPEGRDLSLVSLNQLSAGKLDYYLTRDVSVDVEVGLQEAVVEQRVRLTFKTPGGLPAYVLGNRGGRLDELVDLGVSAQAEDVELLRDGEAQPFALVDDSGSLRLAFPLVLDSPAVTELVVRYRVPAPDGRYGLVVLPQPLTSDADSRVRLRPADGVTLDDGAVDVSGPLTSTQTYQVQAVGPGWWERPVELPW